MGKVIKWLFITLFATAAALCSLLIGGMVFAPQLLVNNRTLPHLVKYLERSDIVITYDSIDVTTGSDSLLDKVITIEGKKLCVAYETVFSGCYDRFVGTVKVNLLGKPVVLRQIGPISAKNGTIDITLRARDEKAQDEPFDFKKITEFLKYTSLKPIMVDNTSLTLTDAKGKTSKADVNFDLTQTDASAMEIGALVEGKAGFPVKRLYLKGQVADWDKYVLPDVDLSFNAEMVSRLKITTEFSLSHPDSDTPESASVTLKNEILMDKKNTSLSFVGRAANKNLKGELALNARNMANGVKSIKTRRCQLAVQSTNDYARFSLAVQNCHFDLARHYFENEGKSPIEFPQFFTATLNTNVNFDVKENLTFTNSTGQIDIEPLINDLYKIDGSLDFAVKGDFGRDVKPDFILNVDSTIELHRFQKLVKKLANSAYSIPAPLNTLEGKSRCNLKGKINLAAGNIKVPHTCSVNLVGEEQAIALTEIGVIQLTFLEHGINPKVEADIALENFKMFLPDFKITDPVPKMTRDSRFVDSSIDEYLKEQELKAQKRQLPLDYTINLRTKGKPALIHTPTLKTTIPVDLDLILSSNSRARGTVKLESFDVKILNKKLYVDRVNLQFFDQMPNTIDAMATIERTEFDLILNVFGNLSKPQVDITSDPVRTDSELMSNLLYGGSYNDLDSGQQRSVAETRAAMTDGAIGLISMFYLATTPVESVGYNSHTQQFRANVKLGTGTSLQIGSNLEGQSELGLRKRLRGNWFFETYAISEESNDGTKGVAMLKWANRY